MSDFGSEDPCCGYDPSVSGSSSGTVTITIPAYTVTDLGGEFDVTIATVYGSSATCSATFSVSVVP